MGVQILPMWSGDLPNPVTFLQRPARCQKAGEGDYLALLSAGAYGFAQASNYNTRRWRRDSGERPARRRCRANASQLKEIWSGEEVVAWLR